MGFSKWWRFSCVAQNLASKPTWVDANVGGHPASLRSAAPRIETTCGTSASDKGGDITNLGLRMICDTLNCILRLNLQSVTSIKSPFSHWQLLGRRLQDGPRFLRAHRHIHTYKHFHWKILYDTGKVFQKKKKKRNCIIQ